MKPNTLRAVRSRRGLALSSRRSCGTSAGRLTGPPRCPQHWHRKLRAFKASLDVFRRFPPPCAKAFGQGFRAGGQTQDNKGFKRVLSRGQNRAAEVDQQIAAASKLVGDLFRNAIEQPMRRPAECEITALFTRGKLGFGDGDIVLAPQPVRARDHARDQPQTGMRL